MYTLHIVYVYHNSVCILVGSYLATKVFIGNFFAGYGKRVGHHKLANDEWKSTTNKPVTRH